MPQPKGSIPWNKGRKGIYSEEYRAKLSAGSKGHVLSAEVRALLSTTLTGRKRSSETRAKMGANRSPNSSQRTHGMSKTPTYRSWCNMRQRCLNPNNVAYDRYGGRGITIYAPWLAFEAFLADMGERPKGTSIDRRDNDGPYAPWNCRWATVQEQAANRPLTYRRRPHAR